MSNDPESGTDQIALLIERLNGGDSAVITELIEVCDRRMRRLAKVMLQGRPDVHRWVETNDIHQESVTKLLHTLRMVANGTMKAIDGVKHFERIAARHIRHQLIDQARHFLGPQGEGSKHESHNIDTPGNPLSDAESPSQDQHLLSQWSEFHQKVNTMPDDLAEVFDLIYYADLNQQQTADVLGVSLATVKRRWRDAKLWIYNNLGGQLPGDTGEFPLL